MKVKIRKIEIRYISYEDWIPIQGNLKDLLTKNYQKLKNSFLKKDGFIPAFVWIPTDNEIIDLPDGGQQQITKGKPYILDAHQRQRLFLKERTIFIDEETGEESKKYPCLIVRADNFKDAKERLLVIASQFGTMTQEGLDEYVIGLDEDFIKASVNFDNVYIPEIKDEDNDGMPFDPWSEKTHADDGLFLSIEMKSERECQTLYNELKDRGFKIKIV